MLKSAVLGLPGPAMQTVQRRWARILYGPPPRSDEVAAVTLDAAGNVLWGQRETELRVPFSTIKILTALVARDHIRDMDATVEVLDSDVVSGSSAGLSAGDLLSYRDLFYASLLPSGNDATMALARSVGEMLPGKGDPVERFTRAMSARGHELGWRGHVIKDATGRSPGNRLSPLHLAGLARVLHHEDPWLFDALATSRHSVAVKGVNSRLLELEVTALQEPSSVAFPIILRARKTGSCATGEASVVAAWETFPDGPVNYSAVLGSTLEYRSVHLSRTVSMGGRGDV